MARDNSYPLFSRSAYETESVKQSFLDVRGAIYFPPTGDEEQGVEMTPDNATIRQAYEAKYGVPLPYAVGEDGVPRSCAYDDCTHVLCTLPNMTHREYAEIVRYCDDNGVTEEVVLSHAQMRAFKALEGAE